jgi:hypothetical protein
MTDHITLPVTHTYMMNNPQAIAQALSFIATGRFDPGISWMDSVFGLIGPGCGGGACGSSGLSGGAK